MLTQISSFSLLLKHFCPHIVIIPLIIYLNGPLLIHKSILYRFMFSLAQHSMTGSFLFKFKVWKLFLKKKPKKNSLRHCFEENSQDLFLLREFQNTREGPDTCICQRRFPNSIHLKKTPVFRKADMTAQMEQLFYTQGRRRETSRRQSLFPECFTCSSSSFLCGQHTSTRC